MTALIIVHFSLCALNLYLGFRQIRLNKTSWIMFFASGLILGLTLHLIYNYNLNKY